MCNLAAQTQQHVLVFVQKSPWGGVQEQQSASFADQHHDQENIEARCERESEKPNRVSDGRHLSRSSFACVPQG
jgi:hypothetical protein